MIPTSAIRVRAMRLLITDPLTLADPLGLELALVKSDFTPSENLQLGDIDLATFDGAGPILAAVSGPRPVLDPQTNSAVIEFQSAILAWRWQVSGLTDLPQTIYGYALVGLTVGVLASELLDTPLVLTGVGQVVDLAEVTLSLPPNRIV
jgi:hypothetical protein